MAHGIVVRNQGPSKGTNGLELVVSSAIGSPAASGTRLCSLVYLDPQASCSLPEGLVLSLSARLISTQEAARPEDTLSLTPR